LRKEKARARVKGTRGMKPAKSHIKALIPVMSHFDCAKQGAGLWQIDLVQHDGGNPSGEFCHTLTVTEVANCWTAHYPLQNKAFKWVYEAMNRALATLGAVHSYYDSLLNYFYPCQKLLEKERDGSKVRKAYDKPRTLFDRIVSDGEVPGELRDKLVARKAAINLVAEMEAMQKAIDRLPSFADPVPEFVPKRGLKPLLFGSRGLIF